MTFLEPAFHRQGIELLAMAFKQHSREGTRLRGGRHQLRHGTLLTTTINSNLVDIISRRLSLLQICDILRAIVILPLTDIEDSLTKSRFPIAIKQTTPVVAMDMGISNEISITLVTKTTLATKIRRRISMDNRPSHTGHLPLRFRRTSIYHRRCHLINRRRYLSIEWLAFLHPQCCDPVLGYYLGVSQILFQNIRLCVNDK